MSLASFISILSRRPAPFVGQQVLAARAWSVVGVAERIRVELGLVRCPRGAIKAHDANNLAVSRHSSGVELDLRRGSSCIP